MSSELGAAEKLGAMAWLGAGTPLERATRLLAVLTGFSIPLSTSFSEITTALFMACWLLSGGLGAKWALIRRNRVAVASLALFAVLAAGIVWSSAGWIAGARCLLKYRELIYLPMFLVVFQDARLRKPAVWAYMAAAVLLLGLSYYERFTGADFGIASTPQDYVIAKDRIIHSLMMAFLAYLAAVQFAATFDRDAASGHSVFLVRCTFAAIVPLAVYNILFMVQGRTGYLILGALTTLFLCERLGRRGIAIACMLLGITVGCALKFSTMIQGRVEQTISQLKNQFGPERKHSADPRMEFYVNTIRLIARHPILGAGTGSFRSEYARLVARSDDIPTSDPHNEYLHLASQVGLPGAALLVWLLALQWSDAGRLAGLDRNVGRGVVLTIALGSLFNSLILSVTGGLIFSYFGGLALGGLRSEAAADTDANPNRRARPESPRRQAA